MMPNPRIPQKNGMSSNGHFTPYPVWMNGTKGNFQSTQMIEPNHVRSGGPTVMVNPGITESYTAIATASSMQGMPGVSAKPIGIESAVNETSGILPISADNRGMPSTGRMESVQPMPGMNNLVFMENHIATQALVAEQQRRIDQLQKDLGAAQLEIERLKNQAMELERERAKKEGNGEDGRKSSSRYWTPDEHQRFLEGLDMYGHKEIKAISRYVRTRNATQVRTHAQKYYLRLQREKSKKDGDAGEDGAATQSSGRQSTDELEGAQTASKSARSSWTTADGEASNTARWKPAKQASELRPASNVKGQNEYLSAEKPPAGPKAPEASCEASQQSNEKSLTEHPEPRIQAKNLNSLGIKGEIKVKPPLKLTPRRPLSDGGRSLLNCAGELPPAEALMTVPKLPLPQDKKEVAQREGTKPIIEGAPLKKPRHLTSSGIPDPISANGTLIPPNGFRSSSRESLPKVGSVPRIGSNISLNALNHLNDSDRGFFASAGMYTDDAERRADPSDAAILPRAGIKRSSSILSLLGKPTGLLSESPSTDRLLSMFHEQEGEKIVHARRGSSENLSMRESFSFTHLNGLQGNLDELDDAKDIALNIPEAAER